MRISKLTFIIPFLLANAPASADEFDEFSDYEGMTFITPTKSAKSIHFSPNSVTKLSSEDLLHLGVETIPDALRFVPGMLVADVHGSNTQAGYHGLAVSLPRRMDVLFNSSSVFRPGYAGIHWRRMPFSVEDLVAIEVVRGSATSDFGSNAFTGAVNLIQEPIASANTLDASARTVAGDTNRYRTSFHVGNGNNHFYGRFFFEEGDGYDFEKRTTSYDDSFDGKSGLFSGEHALAGDMLVDWSVAFSQYEYTAPSFSFIGSSDVLEESQDSVESVLPANEDNVHVAMKLSGNKSLLQKPVAWSVGAKYSLYDREQDINFCNIQGAFDPLFAEVDASDNISIDSRDYPLILQSGLSTGVVQLNYSIVNTLDESDMALLAALGQQLRIVGMENILTEICGLASLDSKEERYSINGQFSTEINQFVSVSASADIIHSEADSQAYFQGRVSRDTYQLTMNTLIEPHEMVAFNFGFMMETDDYLNKVLFSPRVSYHLKLSDTNSLRALYSQSKRSPDLHETDRQWQFIVDYADGQTDYLGRTSGTVFRLAETKAELTEETIDTVEIGFAHSGFNSRSTYDIKAFYEEMDDLISAPFTYLDFNLINSGKVLKKGFESGWTYELETLKFGAGYTYLDINANNIYETTLSARHIGNFWAIKSLPWDAKLALSYSGFSGGKNGSYDRFEATYTQMFDVKDTDVQVQFGVKRYPEYTSVFTDYSATDPAQIGFSDRDRLFGKVKVAF